MIMAHRARTFLGGTVGIACGDAQSIAVPSAGPQQLLWQTGPCNGQTENMVAKGPGLCARQPSPVGVRVKNAPNDQRVGIDILRRALQSPARQIVENAGADGSVVVGKLLENTDVNHGFDAQTGEYVNMMKAGIIDPLRRRR